MRIWIYLIPKLVSILLYPWGKVEKFSLAFSAISLHDICPSLCVSAGVKVSEFFLEKWQHTDLLLRGTLFWVELWVTLFRLPLDLTISCKEARFKVNRPVPSPQSSNTQYDDPGI